jgi:Epoxide hydrolase N terminus
MATQSSSGSSGPIGTSRAAHATTAGVLSGSSHGQAGQAIAERGAIRPFRIDIPQEALADLRRRITETRWPERETVTDTSQGVRLDTIQKVAWYWATEYDWRTCEAKLNALPNFITQIDGLDIHFIHVRSKHENALPLIVTHGWPGSVIEQLKIIEPLTNPTAHGGSAGDAFHVVMPLMPGYGFSGKPCTAGWGPERIAAHLTDADAASWLRKIHRTGWRLGRDHHRSHGSRSAFGLARHSH